MEDNFDDLLLKWRKELDNRLLAIFENHDPPLLYEPIHYVLAGGGKRIRPILLILACKAIGGEIGRCWDAAVAVELLHNFTLVHDDIMDQDQTRRGRVTVHEKWDSNTAILTGDGLLGLAYKILLRTESDQIQKILTIFTHGVIELCEGQALDLEFEERVDVTLDDYLNMIGKKTAQLLSTSTRIGALIGDGTSDEVDALGQFGCNLGCAFQIQDDLLDITSDETTLGKTYASDVKQKKKTYLLVHTLTNGDVESKNKLRLLLKEPNISSEQIGDVKSLFEKSGSIAAAKSAIEKYILSAKGNLDKLRPNQAKDVLVRFLSYISDRRA